jgi:hypothetical protein
MAVILILIRIDQLVGVQDEVAGMGVVDRRLSPRFPRLVGLSVVGIGADQLDL